MTLRVIACNLAQFGSERSTCLLCTGCQLQPVDWQKKSLRESCSQMKYITCQLTGGLGNQMFIYAFAKALSLRLNIPLKLDTSWYSVKLETATPRKYTLSIFEQITDEIAPKSFASLYLVSNKQTYTFLRSIMAKLPVDPIAKSCGFAYEKKYPANENIRNYVKTLKLDGHYFLGYWQTESFFADKKTEIKHAFEFPKIFDIKNNEVCNLLAGKFNSVSLHVRRGDYLRPEYAGIYGGICTTEYYKRSIREIITEITDPQFFVFSDDVDYVRQNLQLPENTIYVDWNQGEDSYRDMQLMSLCCHHIIANSSFSWWGAWLGDKGRTIAPKNWYADRDYEERYGKFIVPNHWTRVSSR